MRREERRRGHNFVHRHIPFYNEKVKDVKRSPNFQHSRPSIFAQDCLLFFTLKSFEVENNHETQICRESNLLSNHTSLALIQILSQTLWPKYRTWLKTPFLANFLKKVWSEDFLLNGPTRFWLFTPWVSCSNV